MHFFNTRTNDLYVFVRLLSQVTARMKKQERASLFVVSRAIENVISSASKTEAARGPIVVHRQFLAFYELCAYGKYCFEGD